MKYNNVIIHILLRDICTTHEQNPINVIGQVKLKWGILGNSENPHLLALESGEQVQRGSSFVETRLVHAFYGQFNDFNHS